MAKTLIVTDLDGTLLDHDHYGCKPAAPALEEIRRRGIPLVLCSSKTAAEIRALQAGLKLAQPYICENGAAVFEARGEQPWHEFARPRDEVLEQLHKLRREKAYQFSGFADYSTAQLSELTGLPEESAALAAQREYSEPLQWQDSPERLESFEAELADLGLTAQQGGRFLSVSSPCDKGTALLWLRQQFSGSGELVTVALGDSPNDLELLAAADIAVIIQSRRSDTLQVTGPSRVIRSELPGPRGWQQVMGSLLEAGELP